MNAHTGAEQRHYQRMVGGTIAGIGWEVEAFDQPTPVLIIKLPSNKILHCTVLCDPEGNGPGFLAFAEAGS